MADDPAVQKGATEYTKPDEEQILERSDDGDDYDPLAEGGGEVEDIDAERAEMGEENDDDGPKEVESKDKLEDITTDEV